MRLFRLVSPRRPVNLQETYRYYVLFCTVGIENEAELELRIL